MVKEIPQEEWDALVEFMRQGKGEAMNRIVLYRHSGAPVTLYGWPETERGWKALLEFLYRGCDMVEVTDQERTDHD